jgi:CheY-like chemotaxis protein
MPPAAEPATPFALHGAPCGPGPLHGLTVLVVEDSRFASDAFRLMCHRLGARMRRADSLCLAQAHLRTYRPDVVIVDLGLPDGPGESLIQTLARAEHPPKVLLGTSGDPVGRAGAMAAGAMGFVEKPPGTLATFAQAILDHLPDNPVPAGDVPALPLPRADPLALQDDLRRIAALTQQRPSDPQGLAAEREAHRRDYIARFLRGLGRLSGDATLANAAHAAACGDTQGLARMIESRLGQDLPL